MRVLARGQFDVLQWFAPAPLAQGVEKTVAFLRAEGLVPKAS